MHDGVLQVLALVQRRGTELGGDAEELGRLAGEQEVALRTLIRAQDSVTSGDGTRHARRGRPRSPPWRAGRACTSPRPAPRWTCRAVPAAELVAAVGACLDNVAVHVGEGAPVWVLLESFPDRVEVSVRDEGPGIPEGRLDAAEGEGRLGVSESIRGRMLALGGSATLRTGAQGTEWELVLDR